MASHYCRAPKRDLRHHFYSSQNRYSRISRNGQEAEVLSESRDYQLKSSYARAVEVAAALPLLFAAVEFDIGGRSGAEWGGMWQNGAGSLPFWA